MPIFNLKLLKRYPVANNTYVFEFEKPIGFTFTPGQYGGMTLLSPSVTDEKGATRRFSILSTPQDDYLAFVTRIQSSAFKQSLQQMQVGELVKFAGPTGNFILHDQTSIPAVFIAGGVGIAPFYSMLRHAWQISSNQTFYLFYGNRSSQDAAFFTDLQTPQPHFHYIPVLEQAEANWQGERGYITEAIIRKTIPDMITPIYYVCGAPAMVTVIQELLLEMSIPADHIKVEDFPGY